METRRARLLGVADQSGGPILGSRRRVAGPACRNFGPMRPSRPMPLAHVLDVAHFSQSSAIR